MSPAFLAPLSSAAVFTSAVLVFWMEPLFAKMILPSMGGAAAVWVTALMFYQAVLLLGYVYAHLSSRMLPGRVQVAVHAILLGAAVLVLPAIVPEFGGLSTQPTMRMLAVLSLGTGLPLLALSATAPLVQHWFSRSAHRAAADPYFLYAASNVGSLGALLAFPLVIEPNLGMSFQNNVWTGLFVVAAVLILGCGVAMAKRGSGSSAGVVVAAPMERAEGEPPKRWRWLVLSAVPSSLLSGTTTIISTDIAPGPLLWLVPLGLYLLTFILTFGRREIFPTRLLLLVQVVLLFPALLAMLGSGRVLGEYLTVASLLLLLFVSAFLCHRRLFNSRPEPGRLTEFYLTISLGGLIGGSFNALVAPQLFSSVLEYPLALLAALLLRPRLVPPARWHMLILPPVVLGIAAVALGRTSLLTPQQTYTLLVFLLPLAAIVGASQPIRVASIIGLALVLLPNLASQVQLHAVRNFYGVLRVAKDGDNAMRLTSGTTLHGMQSTELALRREPTLYFSRQGPLGDVFQVMAGRLDGDAVSVIGLGVGTIACYAPENARWTFVDINPEVLRLATDSQYFTFLRDCQPNANLLVADGRLALGKAGGSQSLIILDAFSSDSVPMHLITREAMELYFSHLAPDGVVAVHITNRFLDLQPQFAALASSLGIPAVTRRTEASGKLSADSRWVVLSRSTDKIAMLKAAGWSEMPAATSPPWTDDQNDLLSAIVARWRS